MSWNFEKLGSLIKESRIPAESPNPNKRIRVKLNIAGVEKRPFENEIAGATKQFIRKTGQFIYGKQNFHKGAFGIVPEELDGFETSADIPSFDVREDCLPTWIFYFFKIGNRYLELEKIARGVGSKRIHPEQIVDIEIPLPDIQVQKQVISKFKKIEESGGESLSELSLQLSLLKNLRQQILQDAVQGKLVPQDPSDEPASHLLERIKAEKEKLIREKKIKPGKPLPPIKPEEIPYEIPEGWVWCRLGEIVLFISTGPFGTMLHKSDYIVQDGIPLVNPKNIVDGKIFASNKMMINEKTKERLKSYILFAGDIVVGRRGEMGRCAVVSEDENEWVCGTGSFFLRLFPSINNRYFVKLLRSEYAKSFLLGSSVGATMNNLNHRILNSLLIPLPPYNEQNRIVAKIDQVMQLCDKLEQAILQNQQYTRDLMQVALREALEENQNKK